MKSGGSGASNATRSPACNAGGPQALRDRGDTARESGERERVATTHRDRSRAVGLPRHERGQERPTLAGRRSPRPANGRLRLEQALDPRIGQSRDILLLHDEMPGEREAVELGLRQARPQVGGEAQMEDRIALAPGDQHGHCQLRNAIGDGSQRRERRVRGSGRNIRHEVRNGLPVAADPYGDR